MLYFFLRAMAKSQQEHGTLTKQHVLLYTDSIINKINQYECECEDCKEQCSTKNIIQIYANFKMLLTNSKFNNKGISQLLSQETDELEIYNTTIINNSQHMFLIYIDDDYYCIKYCSKENINWITISVGKWYQSKHDLWRAFISTSYNGQLKTTIIKEGEYYNLYAFNPQYGFTSAFIRLCINNVNLSYKAKII